MSSYLEKLRVSRDKAQVAYQEFALSTRQKKDSLFCFFEGKDNAYYVSRIRNYTDDYCPIRCGGRNKVLAVYELITRHSEYDKYKKAFFINRDFNPPLPLRNPPILETPYYSIENFYVSVEVFKRILINEFYLSEISDRSFQICEQLLKDRQQEFHQAVTLFNAWYACLIDLKNSAGKQTEVNLNEKLPKNFVSFSLQTVKSNYELVDLKQTFPDATEVTAEVLDIKLQEFYDCKCHRVFRGKYELEFMLRFIELILQDASNNQKYLQSKVKLPFGDKMNNEQAISIFSSYAETPDCLKKYLQKVS